MRLGLSWKLSWIWRSGFFPLRNWIFLFIFGHYSWRQRSFLCWSVLGPFRSVFSWLWGFLLWFLNQFWLALSRTFLLSKESGEVKSEGRVLGRAKLELVNVVVGEVVGEHLRLLAGAPLGKHIGGAVPRQGGGCLTHLGELHFMK